MSVYTVYSPHAVYRLIRLIFPIFSSRVSTTCIAMSCHRQEFPPENCNETQKILSHGHPSELICVDTSEMILVVLWKFTVTIRAGQIIYISLKCSPQYTFPGEKRFRFFFFSPLQNSHFEFPCEKLLRLQEACRCTVYIHCIFSE